jgi:formylmethanofuran dehydrogenase subunit E
MSTEDSYMISVRERMARHDFLESTTKPGLFYKKIQLEGIRYYIDMRRQPMRMYGYKEENGKDNALDNNEVAETLRAVKKDLVSIGCDLNAFGVTEVESEPEEKEEKETEITCPKCKHRFNK